MLATSAIHLKRKLHMLPSKALELAGQIVAEARPLFEEVEFCCEDASRSDRGFLAEVCAAVIEAGADVINLPDTVGYGVPVTRATLFRELPVQARLSAHCHDDLGLAVANTLAAVQAGASQVECTINGIGERAGNAALEEVATALTPPALPKRASSSSGSPTPPGSSLDSPATPMPPHKAILGAQLTPN